MRPKLFVSNRVDIKYRRFVTRRNRFELLIKGNDRLLILTSREIRNSGRARDVGNVRDDDSRFSLVS